MDAHVTIHILTSCTSSIIISNLRISVASRDYLCRHGDCPSNDLAGGQSQSNGPECRQLCEERSDCLLYLTTTKQSASHSCYLKNAICETLNVDVQPGVSCDNFLKNLTLCRVGSFYKTRKCINVNMTCNAQLRSVYT